MTTLQLQEITPGFGARIEGWSLDDEAVAQLRRAFDEFGVLVFRDVELTADEQRVLCGSLVGDEPPADRAAAVANSHLYSTRISNKDEDGNAPFGRLLFHADGMWSESPQELLSLYGEQVEPPSVPTIYVSATGAWDRLSEDLRARVDGRTAVHLTGQRDRGGYDEAEILQAERRAERSRSTPVELIHPRTGDSILYVSQMMTGEVEGLDPEESEALLEELFAVLYDEDHAFEHDWREGDLVVWDNLAVQHGRGLLTQEGTERSLRKVSAPAPSEAMKATAEKPAFARK